MKKDALPPAALANMDPVAAIIIERLLNENRSLHEQIENHRAEIDRIRGDHRMEIDLIHGHYRRNIVRILFFLALTDDLRNRLSIILFWWLTIQLLRFLRFLEDKYF